MDSTEHDNLAALDFVVDNGEDYAAESDPLDFSATDDLNDAAPVDALGDYAPVEIDGGDLDALEHDTEIGEDEDDLDPFTHTVTNPAGTVSVSALIDGSIRHVELAPAASKMTESQLCEEILVLARLARQKGLAGQRSYLMENEIVSESMRELGLDVSEAMRDLMENGMGLPTPEQAAAEEAEVFATRFASDDD